MGIVEDVENAGEQLWEGYEKADALALEGLSLTGTINVVGIGGSAMAGELLGAVLRKDFRVHVQRGPEVFVEPGELSFFVSYSGNTWETILALKSLVEGGAANLVVFTSDGFMERYASERGVKVVSLTPGRQPRADLYEQLVAMLRIVERLGYTRLRVGGSLEGVREVFELWKTKRGLVSDIAHRFVGRSAAVYGYGGMSSAALRWKQQLNENSKIMAWREELPEAFHNSIVGWGAHRLTDEYVVVLLRDRAEEPDPVREEIDWFAGFLGGRGFEVVTVDALGGDRLSRILGMCYLGDLVSLDLAMMRGVDPEAIEAISSLKSHMRDWGVERLYR